MEQIESSLAALMHRLGLNNLFPFYWLQTHWQEIVGHDLAFQARPVRYLRGKLFIGVKSSVWNHHLSMMKETLKEKINQALKQNYVCDIYFQTAAFNLVQEETELAELPLSKVLQQIELTATEKSSCLKQVETVQDLELKRKLAGVLLKNKTYEKYRLQQGYHSCAHCGILCPPGAKLCDSCLRKEQNEHLNQLRALLKEAPWWGYDEFCSVTICRPDEIERIRQEAIQNLVEKGESLSLIEQTTLAMLVTRKSPLDLTQEQIDETLKTVRRKKHVSTPRRRSGGSTEKRDSHYGHETV